MQSKADIVQEAAKATPPAVVAGMTVAGYTLNDIVLLVTLVYVLLQIAFLIFKWWQVASKKSDGGDNA
jgi:hypothetical protein